MKEQLLKFWRTINIRPPKNKGEIISRKALTRERYILIVLNVLLALRHITIGLVGDGIIFALYAVIFAVSVITETWLVRGDYLRIFLCALYSVVSIAALFVSSGSAVMFAWFFFIPVIVMRNYGFTYGCVASGVVSIMLCIIYFTPLCNLTTLNTEELGWIFPLVFIADTFLISLMEYSSVKSKIERRTEREAMDKSVKGEHDKLMAMTTQTILSISNAVDARDPNTRQHSSRVAKYAVAIARGLGWSAEKLENIHTIALLHDIGKIGISDSILKKDSDLTEDEYEIIKTHTVIGEEILKDLSLLPNATVGAVAHHERFDGKGYPYGLKGKNIPIEARIIGIADAFDAMSSNRVYRTKMSKEDIIRELENGSGTQFDPDLLDIFLPLAREILRTDKV